jgi:HEPN domain-containing protein
MNDKVRFYLQQSDEFWRQAEVELREGNLRQASEKSWGAASQMVKAYAQQRGLRHNGHAWLFQAVDEIANELKDEKLKNPFGLAGMLHTNFYEGWLTEGQVKSYVSRVREFCDKVRELIEGKTFGVASS